MILLLVAEMAQFADAMSYAYGVANFDAAALGEASIVPQVVGPGGALLVKAMLMLAILATVRWKAWLMLGVSAAGVGVIGLLFNVFVMGGIT